MLPDPRPIEQSNTECHATTQPDPESERAARLAASKAKKTKLLLSRIESLAVGLRTTLTWLNDYAEFVASVDELTRWSLVHPSRETQKALLDVARQIERTLPAISITADYRPGGAKAIS